MDAAAGSMLMNRRFCGGWMRVDAVKGSRTECFECGEKIATRNVRIGKVVDDGTRWPVTYWYHIQCVGPMARERSAALEGVGDVRWFLACPGDLEGYTAMADKPEGDVVRQWFAGERLPEPHVPKRKRTADDAGLGDPATPDKHRRTTAAAGGARGEGKGAAAPGDISGREGDDELGAVMSWAEVDELLLVSD